MLLLSGDKMNRKCVRRIALILVALSSLPVAAEQLPFQQAIELALKRSGTLAIAQADREKARQSYLAARSGFIPAVTLGSGLGYSRGVPPTIEGSAPSLFNLTSQSMVLNFAQHDLMKAATADWKGSDYALEDKKNDVILSTAIAYAELDNLNSKLTLLHEQQIAAQKAQFITEQRVKEGLEAQLEMQRAKLLSARIELKLAESEGAADVLRERLSKLTGIAPDKLETVTDSVPKTPDISQDRDAIEQAIASSAAVKSAEQHVISAKLKADAERKQMRPAVDFYTQYQLLAKYNNYQDFFKTFQRNALTVGASIRFPIFNTTQKTTIASANADTIKARRQAEDIRNQISEDTLKLQRSLRQLAAAREVARLEYEISQANIDQVQLKIEAGQATAKDQQQVQIDINDKQTALLDSTLELYKAQMQMLRATGEIQQWAIK
jgi:outer membrane protein TolC